MKRVLVERGASRLILWESFLERGLVSHLANAIDWKQHHIKLFGKEVSEPRLSAWYGPEYTYSGVTRNAAEIPLILLEIMDRLNAELQFSFNSVLCNYYRNGKDSMGWHSDNEREMDRSLIASISAEETRNFAVRGTAGFKCKTALNDGDLLLMEYFQEGFQHSIPKSKRPLEPRINLTFRRIEGVPE